MPFLDRAVGIDLGTTNSEIAWLPPSERDIVIYADRFGRRTVPSAVAWDEKESAFLVGHAARSKRGTAASPVESIKRKMGQAATDELAYVVEENVLAWRIVRLHGASATEAARFGAGRERLRWLGL
jgi:molecular chaperone DnaK (HSP70)